MRVDGKFMVGDDVPEGQGAVTELLSECFDINYDLRLAAEAAAEAEKDHSTNKPPDEPSTDTQAPDGKPET